jgi:hypothetical protein
MMKTFGPETTPGACTWPVQPIYMIKKFGPETIPGECTWPVPSFIRAEKSW